MQFDLVYNVPQFVTKGLQETYNNHYPLGNDSIDMLTTLLCTVITIKLRFVFLKQHSYSFWFLYVYICYHYHACAL